jgi:DNA/RNA endonuclease YhcR with UshA esterase domain
MTVAVQRIAAAVLAAALAFAAPLTWATGQATSAADAARHVGKRATVCGTVASTHFAAGSRGTPTFLNLDRPYPNQIFTAVIWGEDRSRFGEAPDVYYRDKAVCVSGMIQRYRGKPEIVVRSPEQITLH